MSRFEPGKEGGRLAKAPAFLQHTAVKGRVKGYIQITEPDVPTIEGETLMCVHCQYIWIIQPGSGISRGFCMNCNGPTCGKAHCETHCVPFEKAIENMERVGWNSNKLQF